MKTIVLYIGDLVSLISIGVIIGGLLFYTLAIQPEEIGSTFVSDIHSGE